MHGCSNIEFYEAVYRSGCVPMMCVDGALRPGRFVTNLERMAQIATDGEYGVMLHQNDFATPSVIDSIKKHQPKYINYWPRVGKTNEILTKEIVYNGARGFQELNNDSLVLQTLTELVQHKIGRAHV